MIYATTSRGVYRYDCQADRVDLVISNKHTPGFFKKRARGFFGICLHRSGQLIVASRERLGTPRVSKIATDTKLHFLDPISQTHHVIAEIRDAHDVHQIACHGDWVYVTDTGKNRIHVYDLAKQQVVLIITVGPVRDDINHINALLVQGDELLIGLNNRGLKDAEYLRLPLRLLHSAPSAELDAYAHGVVSTIPGRQHTHDIRPWNGHLLICASHAGAIIRQDGVAMTTILDGWVRGIAPCNDGIWVGASRLATRAERHRKIDGKLVHLLPNFEMTKAVTLVGAGQVNDLCWLPPPGG